MTSGLNSNEQTNRPITSGIGRPNKLWLGIWVFYPLIMFCKGESHSKTDTIPLVFTIEIPVQMYTGDSILQSPNRLTLLPGQEDELAQGPTSFDVADNGDILICDPLSRRLVLYDGTGTFRQHYSLNTAVNRVQKTGSDSRNWILSAAHTEDRFLFQTIDQSTQYVLSPGGASLDEFPGNAVLADNNTGKVILPAIQPGPSDTIHIQFENQEALVSIHPLGMDSKKNVLVKLESTPASSDSIQIHVRIDEYDRQSKQVGQIKDLDTDLFSFPLDEYRVRLNKLYRMQPKNDKVIIQIWQLD